MKKFILWENKKNIEKKKRNKTNINEDLFNILIYDSKSIHKNIRKIGIHKRCVEEKFLFSPKKR